MDEPIGTIVRNIQSKINSYIQNSGNNFIPELIQTASELTSDIIKELKSLKEL
jgi:hypothetical protein